MRRLSSSALFAALGAWGYLACAEAQPLQLRGEAQFRANAHLVLIPVTVTDVRGATVNGLARENFTILDNRQPQPIAAFYTEDAPASIGVVMDVSGSMRRKLNWEKAVLHAFLQSSNPEDDFFLITVSSAPAIRAASVDDAGEIEDLVRAANAGGGTALCDALYSAVNRFRQRRNPRRALLVVSDGMDNLSRSTKSDVLRMVVEADVQVYTIAPEDSRTDGKGIGFQEAMRGREFMRDLAEKTGGLSLILRECGNPSASAGKISAAIRNQYVIGYHSPDTGSSGKWHRIQVKVDLRGASVYARSGYQSP